MNLEYDAVMIEYSNNSSVVNIREYGYRNNCDFIENYTRLSYTLEKLPIAIPYLINTYFNRTSKNPYPFRFTFDLDIVNLPALNADDNKFLLVPDGVRRPSFSLYSLKHKKRCDSPLGIIYSLYNKEFNLPFICYSLISADDSKFRNYRFLLKNHIEEEKLFKNILNSSCCVIWAAVTNYGY